MRKISKRIAKNYAQALFELTDSDFSLQESLLSEIETINQLISALKDSRQIFENPAISKNEKKELIKNTFHGKINDILLNLLFLLIDNSRFNLLLDIQNEFANLVNISKGTVVAEVTSAFELDIGSLESLRAKLQDLLFTGKTVKIESKVSPEIIGGIKVKINDLLYDGSIKSRLENLRRRIEP